MFQASCYSNGIRNFTKGGEGAEASLTEQRKEPMNIVLVLVFLNSVVGYFVCLLFELLLLFHVDFLYYVIW